MIEADQRVTRGDESGPCLRYPVVLVPGMLGFVSLLGWQYWYGLLDPLRRRGVRVYPVRVSPLNSTEVRGEQLLAEIARIRAETGVERVNLIGHSQGALTARYAASMKPDWVASVTSVAGPNHGSELADAMRYRCKPGSWRERMLRLRMRFFAWLEHCLEVGVRGPQLPFDADGALASLTTEGVAAFNQRHPQGVPKEWGGEGEYQVAGVRYYSWSGILQAKGALQGRNRWDWSHWLCRYYARYFRRERKANDGFVGRFSSHLGQVIASDYPLDHFDVINQVRGKIGPVSPPLALYLAHVDRLAKDGV